uniref:Cyclic nucleotide-binding domain-containing protein n=1 Tax=Macrostomum lignano TaxID=282301 RepID=A0A1I8JGJ0_9PLAT
QRTTPRYCSFASEFVVDTSQTFYYNWLAVVSAAFSYNLVFIIARSVFTQLQEALWVWLLFDYLTDGVNLIDMFFSSRTGVLEQGLMITDLSRLRRFYRQTMRFKLDVLAVLPTDLLYLVPQISTNGVYVRANRLLKFGKFLEFFDRTEARTNFPNLFRALNLMMYIMVIFHWNACIYFALCLIIGLGKDSWTYPMRPDGLMIANSEPYNFSAELDELYAKYLYSFYWSSLTLTAVAEIPKPVTEFEYVFEIIVLIVGILIFAIIIGSVGSMVTNISAASTEFQQRMDGAKRYMEFRKVGKALEHRVLRWFDYLWENKQSLDEENILGTLPEKLKAEVAIHVHFDTLKRVAIFQDCEPGLLVELVLKLKLQVFSPGDYICRKGDIGKEMYIVKRGKISVVSPDGKTVFVTLGEGSVFGEISILNIPGNKTGNRRTANVRSDGYSDLFCLSKTDLWDALTEYPDARVKLLEKGQQLLRKDNLIDEAVLAKALRAQETMEQKSQRLADDLASFQALFSRTQAEFDATQGRLKRRIARLEKRRMGGGPGGEVDSSGDETADGEAKPARREE